MTQVVYTVIAAVVSPVLLRLLEYFFRERRERRRQAEEAQKAYLLALKCVITNRALGWQTRLEAYEEYKKLGGNSWVDVYVTKLLKDVED
jgi:hypothetical protein